MDIKVLNLEGNKSQNLKISDDLTGLKVNNRLLKYVIDWQINHAKTRLAKTKQRMFRFSGMLIFTLFFNFFKNWILKILKIFLVCKIL